MKLKKDRSLNLLFYSRIYANVESDTIFFPICARYESS